MCRELVQPSVRVWRVPGGDLAPPLITPGSLTPPPLLPTRVKINWFGKNHTQQCAYNSNAASRKAPGPPLCHSPLSPSPLMLLTGRSFFFPPVFWLCPTACGILVPWPGIERAPPALGTWSLIHCATREFPSFFFKFNLILFYYLFLATLGLCCCAQAFSSCSEQGLLFIAVRRLLSHCVGFSCWGARALGMWASVVVAHRLSSCGSRALERRLSSCGAWA